MSSDADTDRYLVVAIPRPPEGIEVTDEQLDDLVAADDRAAVVMYDPLVQVGILVSTPAEADGLKEWLDGFDWFVEIHTSATSAGLDAALRATA